MSGRQNILATRIKVTVRYCNSWDIYRSQLQYFIPYNYSAEKAEV